MEFDFLIEVVSTVDIPIREQKYSAVSVSVVPSPNLVSQFPYYFLPYVIRITILKLTVYSVK